MTDREPRPSQECRRAACREAFTPTRPWHVYCSPNCRAIDGENRKGTFQERLARLHPDRFVVDVRIAERGDRVTVVDQETGRRRRSVSIARAKMLKASLDRRLERSTGNL
jgi:hypothetical protein